MKIQPASAMPEKFVDVGVLNVLVDRGNNIKKFTRQGTRLLLICSQLLFVSVAAADNQPPVFSLTLPQAQQKAEENSSFLKSSRFLLEAARAQAVSSASSLYPRADLTGQYYYQTHVPSLSAAPGGPSIQIGDKNNYNVGPVLSYTLFDGGKSANNSRSAQLRAQAAEQDYRSRKRDIQYALNLTYARLQLSVANLMLTADSFKLAQQQSADIDLRFKVGTASQLDRISAHKELLNYQLLLFQAQNDLAAALRDLFALTEETATYNTERPLPSDLASGFPPELGTPTILVAIDSLDASLSAFAAPGAKPEPPGEDTPQIRSLNLSSQAALTSAKSQQGANWPKLSLSAQSLMAYPDTGKQQEFTNNIFAVNVAFPLWDARLNKGLADRYLNEAKAAELQKAQRLSDLNRDYAKITDALYSLGLQRQISQDAGREAEEIARLTYHSYTAGKSTFLEVQSANLKLMEARIKTERIKYDLINKIAAREYLSGSPKQ